MSKSKKKTVKVTKQDLLRNALAAIPPGLPEFQHAFDQRLGDPVHLFVQSFYHSTSLSDFKTGPSMKTNNARKDCDAIEAHFRKSVEDQDLGAGEGRIRGVGRPHLRRHVGV